MILAIIDIICSIVIVILLLFMSAVIALYNLKDEQRRNDK